VSISNLRPRFGVAFAALILVFVLAALAFRLLGA
jgi:hypothetical protein